MRQLAVLDELVSTKPESSVTLDITLDAGKMQNDVAWQQGTSFTKENVSKQTQSFCLR